MLNRSYILSLTAALMFLLGQISFSQTTQWTISWDQNDEDDMSHYLLYKDTNPGPEIQIATISHPDTLYIDSDIEKGVLYYYRLKAVDLSQNKSEFSTEEYEAIPKIDFPNALKNKLLLAGQSFEMVLDNYVSDPGGELNILQWEITGNTLLNVQLNTLSILLV